MSTDAIKTTADSGAVQESASSKLLSVSLDTDLALTVEVNGLAVTGLLLLVVVTTLVWRYYRNRGNRIFEIDSAEFGVGDQRITLRPNDTDQQIAYQIWVELTTRKIGIEINLEDDVISEIYDSWYNFFTVTRELVKDVPVSKFRRKDTEKIIKLSIEVLNQGLRPHLTKWQARYRRWYEMTTKNAGVHDLSPQDIQKRFPNFEGLERDMLEVNKRLIHYREKMYEIITND